MATSKEKSIFKNGSRTYFYSTLFFPKEVKDAVFTLYAFVRTADDFVDSQPQHKKEFLQFKQDTYRAFQGKKVDNEKIMRFFGLCKKYSIPFEWVKQFLDAMEADLKKVKYNTYKELEKYMYGSAEVIGLMMAALLKLPEVAYPYAAAQGKAMQLINFIRDIEEDRVLGRQYLPSKDMKKIGLNSLSNKTIHKEQSQFDRFIAYELERYKKLQNLSEKGYDYIPRRYRIAVKTAADMYSYTAKTIKKKPSIIFEKKVKPSVLYIVAKGIKNIFV